ncbi:MAG: SurA N-terminal domain-containing protein, partial [Clostridia bacterium]
MLAQLINKRSYKYILVVVLLLVVISMTACASKEEEIVAKVNDEVITKDELYDLLVEQNGKQALDALIAERITKLEVEKQKIEVSEEDINKEITKLKESYGGEDIFNQAMEQYGLTLDKV